MVNQASEKKERVFLKYLISKKFILNLAAIVVVLGLFFGLVFLWLRLYTNHGQAIELSDFVDMNVQDAKDKASENRFDIRVKDSIYVVGQKGGIILSQNPEPFSKVKEGRNIYVTVTKQLAEQIGLGRLPRLYGQDFDRKKKELTNKFEFNCVVVGKEQMPGVPGQILKVMYDGEVIIDSESRRPNVMIDKGGTLEFVISEQGGGSIKIPDLLCEEYSGVQFYLESIGLFIGDITYVGQVDDLETAVVVSQNPRADEGTIERGSSISLEIAQSGIDCE